MAATPDQIKQLYQQYLNRQPSAAEIQGWTSGTYGPDPFSQIPSSGEAQAFAQSGVSSSRQGPTGQTPSTTNQPLSGGDFFTQNAPPPGQFYTVNPTTGQPTPSPTYAPGSQGTAQGPQINPQTGNPYPPGQAPASGSGASDQQAWMLQQLNDPNGLRGQALVDAGNQRFNLSPPYSFSFQDGVIGLPQSAGGGYLAQGPNNGAWGWNPGDSGGGGGGGGGSPSATPYAGGNIAQPAGLPTPYAPPGFQGTPYQPPPFTAPTGLTYQNDPGYQARLQMGTDAIQNAAAAKGSILSGGTLKALERYGQDYGTNEFGNVFNRALQTAGYNAGVGQQGFQNQLNVAGFNQGAGQLGYQNQYGQYQDFINWQQQQANRGLQAATAGYRPPGT